MKYSFIPLIGCFVLFCACEKDETFKSNKEEEQIDFPNEIKVDSGYSYVDFGENRLAVYSPNESHIYESLILAFPPTNGTNTLMRGILRHVADSTDALILSPDYVQTSAYQYGIMIDSLMALKQFQGMPKYFVGYSAGGADAFVEAQRLGDEVDGLVLLAAGRSTNGFLNASAPPLMKICFCSGTEDFVYPANVSLYEDLLKLRQDMKFIEIEGFDHGGMFSTKYPDEIAECFAFVAKRR